MISGPESIVLDDLEDVKDFSNVTGQYGLKRSSYGTAYEPSPLTQSTSLNPNGGLEYDSQNRLKIKTGDFNLFLSPLGISVVRYTFPLRFVLKGSHPGQGQYPFSCGASEAASRNSYYKGLLPGGKISIHNVTILAYNADFTPNTSEVYVLIPGVPLDFIRPENSPTITTFIDLSIPYVFPSDQTTIGLRLMSPIVSGGITVVTVFLYIEIPSIYPAI